ncbi:DUF1801 domain-containing protein [Paenibacillus sp. Leaf72]|uniref:DUF1801 domain-containing protein n=1 Tax=Paenibacillus sp. Leaf72 TaxID=1736234 RepID=UPI0006F4DC35|nr:DUF1801 domain-containing protein [Paenibacillus sp. Leaf72]KQO17160.1 hypothetical protein ASF12_00155 [Paenibacillus sp. Leaf72]
MSKTEEITAFIEALDVPWQVEISNQLRSLVHGVIPDVQERLQYKKPHFLKNGKYAAVISPSKKAVSFTIFNTASLDLPAELFEGPEERKTIKIQEKDTPDYSQLTKYLEQASKEL